MLQYEPVRIPPAAQKKAEVTLLLAPSGDPSAGLVALEPEPANESTTWKLPRRVSVVALVYGPQGLSMRKVKSMMEKDQEVLSQLADYADQTSEVGALVEALDTSEQSGAGMNAALRGFSSRYGVAMPKLDQHAATNEQASALLGALLPAMGALDPLTSPSSAVMQQSAGLAAAVAGLFFGSPVGLAAGGASLFQSMRLMLFPDTEFRSAIAQSASADNLSLCSKNQTGKSHTRVAYLWAHRLPELTRPALSIPPIHVAIGAKPEVPVHPEQGAKSVARLRDWRLVAAKGNEAFPVPVTFASSGEKLELDLSHTKAAPGEYHLQAAWDWDEVTVTGNLFLHPYGNLKAARLTSESRDRLIEGSGVVRLKLVGADFEFLDKLELHRPGMRPAPPIDLPFLLPAGKHGGEQDSLDAEVDTSKLPAGQYRLLLAQSAAPPAELPVTVLPPNPRIQNLPLRANVGEAQQTLELRGSGLDRIEKIGSDAGQVDLSPSQSGDEREIVIHLASKAKQADRFGLQLKVQGLESPLTVSDAIEVRGPRPRITSARKSYPPDFGLALNDEELPVGAPASFSLSAANAGSAPLVEVSCASSAELRQRLRLAAGDRSGGARLDQAGEGTLFLSLDPGTVGRSGCLMQARVLTSDGASEAYTLGRVLRVPRIEQFTLTDQKIGEDKYAGLLKGEDLDTIEQAGWDPSHPVPVQGIPIPVAAEPQKQSLKIALPWPAPAPHAPVYVWLRGENKGRATGVKY